MNFKLFIELKVKTKEV